MRGFEAPLNEYCKVYDADLIGLVFCGAAVGLSSKSSSATQLTVPPTSPQPFHLATHDTHQTDLNTPLGLMQPYYK